MTADEIEQMAKAAVDQGEDKPPKLYGLDRMLYVGLAYLYRAYIRRAALPGQVAQDKRMLLDGYAVAAQSRDIYLEEAKRRNRIGSQLVELEKCGCEHCKRLIRLFDGRETGNNGQSGV